MSGSQFGRRKIVGASVFQKQARYWFSSCNSWEHMSWLISALSRTIFVAVVRFTHPALDLANILPHVLQSDQSRFVERIVFRDDLVNIGSLYQSISKDSRFDEDGPHLIT